LSLGLTSIFIAMTRSHMVDAVYSDSLFHPLVSVRKIWQY